MLCQRVSGAVPISERHHRSGPAPSTTAAAELPQPFSQVKSQKALREAQLPFVGLLPPSLETEILLLESRAACATVAS